MPDGEPEEALAHALRSVMRVPRLARRPGRAPWHARRPPTRSSGRGSTPRARSRSPARLLGATKAIEGTPESSYHELGRLLDDGRCALRRSDAREEEADELSRDELRRSLEAGRRAPRRADDSREQAEGLTRGEIDARQTPEDARFGAPNPGDDVRKSSRGPAATRRRRRRAPRSAEPPRRGAVTDRHSPTFRLAPTGTEGADSTLDAIQGHERKQIRVTTMTSLGHQIPRRASKPMAGVLNQYGTRWPSRYTLKSRSTR